MECNFSFLYNCNLIGTRPITEIPLRPALQRIHISIYGTYVRPLPMETILWDLWDQRSYWAYHLCSTTFITVASYIAFATNLDWSNQIEKYHSIRYQYRISGKLVSVSNFKECFSLLFVQAPASLMLTL